MDPIYSNIRNIRLAKGISQQKMANKMNIVVSAYGKVERGQTKLTIERLKEISEILKMDLMEILNYHNGDGHMDGDGRHDGDRRHDGDGRIDGERRGHDGVQKK